METLIDNQKATAFNLSFVLGIILLLTVTGIIILPKKKTVTEDHQVPEEKKENVTENSLSPVAEKQYTLTEISRHNKEKDCWIAVNGFVYEATEFIASSPSAQRKTVSKECGKDATIQFNAKPTGVKMSTWENIKAGLQNFQVGLLAKD